MNLQFELKIRVCGQTTHTKGWFVVIQQQNPRGQGHRNALKMLGNQRRAPEVSPVKDTTVSTVCDGSRGISPGDRQHVYSFSLRVSQQPFLHLVVNFLWLESGTAPSSSSQTQNMWTWTQTCVRSSVAAQVVFPSWYANYQVTPKVPGCVLAPPTLSDVTFVRQLVSPDQTRQIFDLSNNIKREQMWTSGSFPARKVNTSPGLEKKGDSFKKWFIMTER